MNYYIITGANSELAKSMFKKLIKDNNRVFLSSRKKLWCGEKIDNTSYLDEIDLCDENCLNALCIAVNRFVPLDSSFIIIHCAGDFFDRLRIPEASFERARILMESNYLTLYGVIKYLLPLQVERGGGKIIAFSCNSVKYNYPGMSAFSSSKAAIETLIKITANEWAHKNIVANAFSLPSIKTNAVLECKPDVVAEDLITPDELSESIINEISNFSQYNNGNIISIIKHSKTFFGNGYYERNNYFPES